jgi:hypothetical protein
MRLRLVAALATLLLFFAPPGSAQVDSAHRLAVARYLEASRTVAFLRHFALPIAIRAAATEDWNFDSPVLDAGTILAMESQVDAAEFEGRVLALHVRHISAADANEVAAFYESPPARRFLAVAMAEGNFLPSTDPLLRDGVPREMRPEDKQAFEAFLRVPAAQRLKAAEKEAIREINALLRDFANRAVERHVTAHKLPQHRRGQ